MTETQKPTILVILGITGDLAAKKIIPALFNLFSRQQLPEQFSIVGFGRRNWGTSEIQSYVSEVLKKFSPDLTETQAAPFLNLFSYQSGLFETGESYANLANALQAIDQSWNTKANKLFYLSVPPEIYATILQNLHSSGLTKAHSQEQGWTRVLVEKPFGHDAKTAEQLDNLLGQLFEETQIYRIDHYLAKEMVQNILSFRFSNDLFEHTWHKDFIERIDIRLWETLGVEQRGSFYDGVGALRDVGQNHLLQMLAFITMPHPLSLNAAAIRTNRARVLHELEPLTEAQIVKQTYRSQYDGYQNIAGVKPGSMTETYFRVDFSLTPERFRGVQVSLESGKRLGERRKEIVVTYKHNEPCLCPPGKHLQNTVTFSIEPEERITINFWAKKVGLTYEVEQRTLDFMLRGNSGRPQYVEEYEKLLIDSIVGDQTLFVSTAEVQAMWRFIDPIFSAWQNNLVPLENYQPDSNEPVEQAGKRTKAQSLSAS